MRGRAAIIIESSNNKPFKRRTIMEKFNTHLPKVVCCVILLFMVAFINVGHAAAAQTSNVNVCQYAGCQCRQCGAIARK